MEYRKDIKGVHFYSDGLEFPIAIYEKSDWDILYPLSKLSPIKHPIRHIHYLKLLRTI